MIVDNNGLIVEVETFWEPDDDDWNPWVIVAIIVFAFLAVKFLFL